MRRVNILVTSAEHYPLVYSEDVSARKAVRPSTTRQITQHRRLAVRLVLISLCSISGVESNLHVWEKQLMSISLHSEMNVKRSYVSWHSAFASRRVTAGFSVRRPSDVSVIENGVSVHFIGRQNHLEGVRLE